MEGGFEAERGTARPRPGFEPPVDPGAGPSLHGLALVARIMRGREIAADAAGIPPIDSDQVLDLQRSAGNRLTTGALARWTEGAAEQSVAQELFGQLFAARAADPGLYDGICAALDGLAPQISVSVSGPESPVEIELRGPAGAVAATAAVPPATVELPFAGAFGRAAEIEPEHVLGLTVAGHALELPVPFAGPVTAGGYVALAELRSRA